uniref:Uncharacterized protein n=1 Tax=Anopheles maculatus TaxID=74869 RepID=A0A182SEF0_9DIPT
MDDGTNQLRQQNVSFGRHNETAAPNHLPMNHGWVSPAHLSQRLTNANNDSLPEDNDDSEQEEDYQLLVECIQKGMRPGGARGGTTVSQHDSDELLPLTVGAAVQRASNPTTIPKQSSSHSKNVQTTPAMSKGVGAFEVSPGVGSKALNCLPSTRSAIGGRRRAPEANSPQPTDTSDSTDSTTIYFSLPPSSVSSTAATSSSTAGPATYRADRERIVVGAPNMSSARTALTGSDELPMEQPATSDRTDGGTCAKHKNPERMLQSVERLTQELVSQVEERHGRTDPAVCNPIVTGVQFQIGEKVTTVPGGSVVVRLNDSLHGGSRVRMMVDEEGNLESEEPPSILYQMSMPFVQPEPVALGPIDNSSLAPVEAQTKPVTTMVTSRIVKPVRVLSNPGSPKARKLQREPSLSKDADECKAKNTKSQDAKTVKKEQQTKIAKPAMESGPKVSHVRQPAPKGVTVATGRTPAKPSSGSPVHRPPAKTLVPPPYAQRSTTKKLQPEAGKQKRKPTPPVVAGIGIARQDTFVLDKPTLSMHVPKVPPAGATEPQTDGKPVSKIPLPKGDKTNTPSRIPPPKRTLPAGKQSSKLGALKTSPGGGGVLKK